MYKEIEEEVAAIKKALPKLEMYDSGDGLDVDGLAQEWWDEYLREALNNLYYAAKSIAKKLG